MTFTRLMHDGDGKDITSQFTCSTEGAQCDFDEGGRKAHVSLWFNGPALMILKTDGPKEDAVTQWKLELQPGRPATRKLDGIARVNAFSGNAALFTDSVPA